MTDTDCRRWMAMADRAATGQPVPSSDRQWYERHAAECAVCAGEARFWAALGEVMAKPELLADKSVVTGATRHSSRPLRLNWRPLRRYGGWVSAVAAGTAIAFFATHWLKRQPVVPAPVVVTPTARLVAISGEVRLGAGAVRAGEPLRAGEHLRTEQGRACFVIDTGITTCLDSDSEATLSTVDPSVLAVQLDRGRVVSHLERQPQGRQFVIRTVRASIAAKGTEFSVGVDVQQRVSVHLHEGHLSIRAAADQSVEISAPAAISVSEASVSHEAWTQTLANADTELLRLTRVLPSQRSMELDLVTRPSGAKVLIDDIALGSTPLSALIQGGRRLSISLPGYATVTELLPVGSGEQLRRNYELAELPVTVTAKVSDATAPGADVGSDEAGSFTKQKIASPPQSPRDLLARAQALRAASKYRECAAAYRQLVGSFPSSDEARVAWVSLGELELSELGQPAQALRSFESYLQQPGPLTREARYGRIRALRMLSRKADEQVATAAFLKDYPNSVQSERLRRQAKPR